VNPHILTLSPPLDLKAKWFAPHVAYTIAKMGMSLCVLGMAEEFRKDGIAVNALWPKTIIATEALRIIEGARPEHGRKPEIVADAAYHILTRDSRGTTGHFFSDEEALRAAGIEDFTPYAVDPTQPLSLDLFVEA
jgi:citronellol/citronellal dehydrogenase